MHHNTLQLTDRELECLPLMTCTNKYMASKMDISQKTVEKHVQSINKKFKTGHKLEIVILSIRLGLVKPEDFIIQSNSVLAA